MTVSDLSEAVWLSQLLQAAIQEQGQLRAAFDSDFGAPKWGRMSGLMCHHRNYRTSMCTLQRRCAKCILTSSGQRHVGGIGGDMTLKWR